MIKIKLPYNVAGILETLNNNGFEAYAVGGCIRDLILGIEPKDYDVTTNAKPDEIKEVFSDYKIIDTGIRFGTVTVLSDSEPIEITTYRIDGEYNDNRRPDNVTFTTLLAEDLKRRDFTINAIAYNPNVGIVDLFNGQEDLKNGLLRAIGNPVDRFNEDGLRIMRALRFSSTYGLKIESLTSEAIHNCKNLLCNIAVERIASEFNRLICGKCEYVLRDFHDVFSVFIPEIAKCVGFEQHTKYHNRDVYEHIIATVTAIKPIKHLRLAMFFHDIGKPYYYTIDSDGIGHFKGHAKGSCEIAERFLKGFKYDNETINAVLELVRNHDIVLENNKKTIKRYLNKFGSNLFIDIIYVHIADDLGKAREYQNRIRLYQEIIKTVDEIIAENQCFSLKNLAVNGNDMIELGFKGKAIGEVLNKLLNKVIDGDCTNNRELLLKEAEKWR